MKLYCASSWRNKYQPCVVDALIGYGNDVYDFRHPEDGNHGFSWAEIDPRWQHWDEERFRRALQHPIARRGFGLDFAAMQRAQGCVLVLPAGRSSHLEAGWFVGADRPCWIFMPEPVEPELMYRMASGIVTTLASLRRAIETWEAHHDQHAA